MIPPAFDCGTRSIKRARRSRAAMEQIRTAIEAVIAAERPVTVRQVFYALVVREAVPKTEQAYRLAARLLTEMRREGRVPFSAIADNTRWMRKPASWSSLAAALEQTQNTYRRALWDDQAIYVELWLEKDALAGVLYDVTRRWDVPLTRGFASLSFLHSAAEAIATSSKPARLYYFGDRDPSGVLIDRKIEQTLRELAPGALITLERIAVTPEQIARWELPTRPTKGSDSRARSFAGDSVELDAIPPSELRALAERCITQHIDEVALARTRRAEQAERDTLGRLIRGGLS